MHKRSWLGNRVVWHPTRTAAGRGRATTVIYNRERLPWLTSNKFITACISHEDFRLRFYDTPRIDNLTNSTPIMIFDSNSVSIAELAEFLIWPGTEAVFTEYCRIDLAAMNPSSLFTDKIFAMWNASKVADWHVIDRGALGVSFVRDITDIRNGHVHAVELTDRNFAIYQHDLFRSSALAEQDQIVNFRIAHLEMYRLRGKMPIEHAVSIRQVARMYRYWLFQLAVDYNLPF